MGSGREYDSAKIAILFRRTKESVKNSGTDVWILTGFSHSLSSVKGRADSLFDSTFSGLLRGAYLLVGSVNVVLLRASADP